MVVSMTGYGRGFSESEKLRIQVEVRTVNHRFCEFQIRMPRQLQMLEEKIKKKLTTYIRRGRVEVFVTIEGEGLLHKKVEVDWNLVDQYMSSLDAITFKYQMHPNNLLQTISSLEGVFLIQEQQADTTDVEILLMQAVEKAGEQLKDMRIVEGLVLKKDIKSQLDKLLVLVESLKEYAPLIIEQYRTRLQQRMMEYTSGVVDETRLLNEVAIFTDKADINEELTRLNSHISQFGMIVEAEEAIGRKLDFLVQEMNREVNTIGSKANDAKIAMLVVEMKSLLEKIKEQVQNIE